MHVVGFLVGTAVVLLLIAITMVVAARARRLRWMRLHLKRMRAAGLHDEEVELFRTVARRCDAGRVPLLTRARGTFDAAANDYVRRLRPTELRRDALSQILALRRRIP